MALLELTDLRKAFVTPDGWIHRVIEIPHFSLEPEEHVAISGESGLGKTTLLNLIAGIVRPDSGRIVVAGEEVTVLSESRRDLWRARTLGCVFQGLNLLQGYTCLENVLLGMAFGGRPDRARALELLDRVGLRSQARHRPRHLSAGQQQRVAVARALANHPRLVLADEPTGNLDPRNAREVLTLIRETCREQKAALLLVSHDREVLAQFERVEALASLNRVPPP